MMDEIVRAIDANLSCPEDLGRTLLELAAGREITRLITEMLGRVYDDEKAGARAISQTELMLHRADRYDLFIRRIGSGADLVARVMNDEALLHTTGRACATVLLGPAPIVVNRYCVGQDGSRVTPAGGFSLVGTFLSEALDVDEFYDLHCPDGHAWVLRVGHGRLATQVRFYSRETLSFVFASAINGELSSLVTLCQVFGDARDCDAMPYLRDLARHDAHFVRWAAIQAIGRIDGMEARGLLAEAANDREPQVRKAARRTLELIGAGHG